MKKNAFKSEDVNERFIMVENPNQKNTTFSNRRSSTRYDSVPHTRNFFIDKNNENKTKKSEESLTMDDTNFPLLESNIEKKEATMQQFTYFIDVVKKPSVIHSDSGSRGKLNPGWIKISRDFDKKIIYEYDKSTVENMDMNEMNRLQPINIDTENIERYKEYYINLYGKEEYDKWYELNSDEDYDSDDEYDSYCEY